MKKIKILLMSIFLFMTGLTLGGCTTHFDKDLGHKVISNRSAQSVFVSEVEEEPPLATLEGQKAEKLMSRYRKEEATAPTEKLLKDIGE